MPLFEATIEDVHVRVSVNAHHEGCPRREPPIAGLVDDNSLRLLDPQRHHHLREVGLAWDRVRVRSRHVSDDSEVEEVGPRDTPLAMLHIAILIRFESRIDDAKLASWAQLHQLLELVA